MAKKDYIQANKDWLAAKATEEGVKPLPKGIYYKVLATGASDGKHPSRFPPERPDRRMDNSHATNVRG